MKPHDTFLQLAAMAIDYPLSSVDHGRLDRHLASCTACVRSAAGLRADAMALGDLPRVTLPERRGAEILAAALHPPVVGHPYRLLVLAALLGLLLVGSLAVGAQLLRRDNEDLSVIVPVPSASAGPDASPAPSVRSVPSGSLAVTHADADGTEWIEVRAVDGPTAMRYTEGRDPAWLTDAKLVYTCLYPGSDTLTVCTMDFEGARLEILTQADRPFLAPDRATVAVHRGTIDVGTTWLLAPDGAKLRELSPGAFTRWSPDGAWLLGQPESAVAEVAIIGADGQGFRVLAPGYDPAWSPTGDRVAYVLVDGGRASLRVIDPLTDEIQVLYEATAGSELTAPAWLPSGALVFVLDGDLWRLDAAATEPVPLTTGLAIRADGSANALDISADGRWIAFSSGDGANARVGIASVDGGAQMLDFGVGAVTQPRWMPEPVSVPAPTQPPASAGPGEPGVVGPLGTSWVAAAVPVVVNRPVGRIEAVTAGGPGFVAVGRGCIGEAPTCEAIVWTSVDGRTWVRAPASDATDIGAYFGMSGPEIGMFDVAAGAPGVVAIGYAARPDLEATIWFSPDGVTWERIPLVLDALGTDAGGFITPSRVNAVTWDGRSFVVVGEDRSKLTDVKSLATAKARAAVWTSPDGRTWTRAPHTAALDVGGFIDTTEDPSTGGMRDVMASPNGLVAVGSVCTNKPAGCEPAAWTSADAVTWERAGGMPAISGVLKAIAGSGTRFTAVGAETCDSSPVAVPQPCPALVLTSQDGQTWTQQAFEQPGDLRTLTDVGGRYFATAPDGPEGVWTSGTATTWEPLVQDGGPSTSGFDATAEWHFAATPDVAVWVGIPTETSDPAAWVSGTVAQ